MRKLLIYLCAVMLTTGCWGQHKVALKDVTMNNHAKWQDRRIENIAEWGQFPIFRIFENSDDTIGVPIDTPFEMLPATFIKDPQGLAEHLKRCCYGPDKQFGTTVYILPMNDDTMEVRILTNITDCRSRYYYSGKTFYYNKRTNGIQFIENAAYHILATLQSYAYNATFRHAQYGLCKLTHTWHQPQEDVFLTTTFSPVADTLNQDVAQHVTLDELINTKELKAHNCCCIPRVSSILICDKNPKERQWGNIELGELHNFTIRYFLDYFINTPRPSCHNKYQKAFYIDMVYNSQTRSFDREEVKFDPAKHKNVAVPLY